MTMKTVLVVMQKGGVGKTTFVREAAVCAESMGYGPVGLVDTDKQATLTKWFNRRPYKTPYVANPKCPTLREKLASLQGAGCRVAFVDTPARDNDFVDEYLELVDYVVLPARPTGEDLAAVGETIARIEAAGKPFHFQLSQVRPGKSNLANMIRAEFATLGKVCLDPFHMRDAYQLGFIEGQGVVEQTPSDAKAVDEVMNSTRYLMQCLKLTPQIEGELVHG